MIRAKSSIIRNQRWWNSKIPTPRVKMLAVTSTSIENVVNEVSESAPGQGEKNETIKID